ncbi:PREDICTED: ester hydrolase C11orf54 homolog [Trachymyrmex septentrionalis]|uniref:ester hydrolase C11orf54 homolog n=1 Tax=Trachymyrmex septentrionalis TaxID=34720 RepID=UPI00084F2A3B|nr:PREDICTED: ester hydrolase C11orf54 homolog [Trachymyrmex septentrionalis]
MADGPNGDSCTTDPGHLSYETTPLATPILSEIAEALQNGMQPLFHDVKVDIASCPYLTAAPYNLAGVGLGGNTSIVEILPHGGNVSWYRNKRDIQEILTTSCHDSFAIGSSYATKPGMPYYGHLIVNATYRAPMDLRNESRLVFAERPNGQTTIEKLTDPNQMKATHKCTLFVSEGMAGRVIRVRAKGRKTRDTDIITSMQTVLYERYREDENKVVGLGGVLKMKYGSVACNLMWDDYQEPMLPFDDFIRGQQCSEIYLESDMIAVGAIMNDKPELLTQEQRYGTNVYNRSEFHCFSNYGAGGQFINDTTPDMTEYEGYFNVAEKYQY